MAPHNVGVETDLSDWIDDLRHRLEHGDLTSHPPVDIGDGTRDIPAEHLVRIILADLDSYDDYDDMTPAEARNSVNVARRDGLLCVFRLLRLLIDDPPAGRQAERSGRTDEVPAVGGALDVAMWRELQWAAAQRLARIGTWEWQRGDAAATWSPELYRMWGLDPRTFQPTHDNIRSQVHPDDRATFDAIRMAAIRTGQASDGTFRVIHPDGRVGYLAASIIAARDTDGQLAWLHGITLDVTHRVHAER